MIINNSLAIIRVLHIITVLDQELSLSLWESDIGKYLITCQRMNESMVKCSFIIKDVSNLL